MRRFILCVFGAFLVWPIHSTVASAGDKPIDMMLSDFTFLLMPLTYFIARTSPTKLELKHVTAPIRSYSITPTLALLFLVYAGATAGIGYGMSGEMTRLFSAFKLAKPVGFVLMGMLLGSWTDPIEFIKFTSYMFGALVSISMFFTVTGPEFPFGYWGNYIGEWELSGYPNTPMSFYAGVVPLLLAAVDSSKFKWAPLIGWGLAICSTLMILGSMSRSSFLVLACGVIIYLASTGRIPFLMASGVTISLLSIIGFGLFSMLSETQFVSILVERIQIRLDRSTESEDPTSGRWDIWELAFELWTERPAFGYMFESFSHYAPVDTPHQQYLEVVYKCGGIGLALYLGILFTSLVINNRLIRLSFRKSGAWYRLHGMRAMMIGIMVGNLTQPNLTYSLTGNFIFLLFGMLCSSRSVVSASQPIHATNTVAGSTGFPPSRRFAA